MHRFIQSSTGTVLFRMSVDAEHYGEDGGQFEVRYFYGKSRSFTSLLEAFLFYYTVDEEAELWEKSGAPTLIECKVKFYLN